MRLWTERQRRILLLRETLGLRYRDGYRMDGSIPVLERVIFQTIYPNSNTRSIVTL